MAPGMGMRLFKQTTHPRYRVLDLSFSVTSPPRWVTGAQNVLPRYSIHRCHECRFRFRWISAKNAPWAEPGWRTGDVFFARVANT